MKNVLIPMAPGQRPDQRTGFYKKLPAPEARPPIEVYGCEAPGTPKRPHYRSQLIVQAEWAWSPLHNRLSAYQLHPSRQRWLFWCGFLDDCVHPWRWEYVLVSSCPRKGVDPELAAISLLAASWSDEATHYGLGAYHWLNQTGLLTAEQVEAVAREVWPEFDPVEQIQ